MYQHQYGHGAVVPPHPLLSQQPPQPQQPQLCFAASHALPPFPAPMAVMAITGVPPTASVARPSIAPFHPSSSLRNVLPSGPPQQQHKPPPPTLPPPLPSRASLGRTQSMPALSHIPPPPPPHLLRQRSYSSLSRPYRTRTGYFLSQHLDSVDEADFEDVAEMVVNMHVQERDYYAPPLAYFKHLEQVRCSTFLLSLPPFLPLSLPPSHPGSMCKRRPPAAHAFPLTRPSVPPFLPPSPRTSSLPTVVKALFDGSRKSSSRSRPTARPSPLPPISSIATSPPFSTLPLPDLSPPRPPPPLQLLLLLRLLLLLVLWG